MLESTSKNARRALMAAACCAIALLASAAPAQADPVDCGDVLTESVTLEADLLGCPGTGLVIGADRIAVDLNGHRIESGTFNVAPGIDNSGGYDRVSIQNGQISGFSVGVALTDADRNTLSGLAVTDNGEGVALASSDRNRIADSQVSDNGSAFRTGEGVTLDAGSDRNRLTDLEVAGNEGNAVVIASSADNEIADSTLSAGASTNVVVTDSPATIIRRSSITAATLAVSISASDQAAVIANEISGGGSVTDSDDAKVARNTISQISVDGGEDNVIRGNVVGAVADDGIVIGTSTIGARVVRNVSNGNFGDGIDVRAPGTLIRGNTANSNFELGIRGVSGVIDGGGNSATGNGDPQQCVNVAC